MPARLTERRLEVVSTVLLAVATVATAWAAYQAREWTGQQASSTAQSTATRISENRAAALVNRQVQIDVATFVQWLDARSRDDAALARFYRERFRDEFQPAFAAWLATRPFTDDTAPATPFVMPAYRLAAEAEADALGRSAAAASQRAKAANEHANNDMLAVVLFALALFFAGISTKLHSLRARAVVLGLGCVIFFGTLVWVATLPMRVTL